MKGWAYYHSEDVLAREGGWSAKGRWQTDDSEFGFGKKIGDVGAVFTHKWLEGQRKEVNSGGNWWNSGSSAIGGNMNEHVGKSAEGFKKVHEEFLKKRKEEVDKNLKFNET